MKKRTAGIILLLLMTVLAAAAFADGPVNPYREDVMKMERRIQQELKGDLVPRFSDNDSVTMTDGVLAPCQTLKFKAVLENTYGYTEDELCYRWTVFDNGRDYSTVFSHNYDTGTETFEYYFYSAGEYTVVVYVFPAEYKDSDYWGRFVFAYPSLTFTIPEDGVHPTLEQRAQEIVDEQRGATQWDTALNLYEWLTGNCNYDYEYHRYSADIIFSGSGVCDAFSRAYKLLLETAGIPAERTFGPNHAWNTLQLDGKWYQADPTWDGKDTHQFFCLSAAAMIPVPSHSYEGGLQTGEHAAECTSMDANYFIHTGKWREFGKTEFYEDPESEYGWSWQWVSCSDQIRNELAKGNGTFTIECWKDDEYGSSNAFSYQSIRKAVLDTGFQQEDLRIGGDRIRFRTEECEEYSTVYLKVLLTGWDIEETGTLELPGSLKSVGENAFEGSKGATTAVIPYGCTEICSGAFRDTGVRTVMIPATVTSVGDHAFDSSEHIIFITESEAATAYAQQYGNIFAAAP